MPTVDGNAKRILMVVAKAPARGQTKTRLGGAIGLDAAADFYRCLLLDTLDVVRGVPNVTHAIAYLPPGAEDVFRELAPDFRLIPQHGDNLGERLHHVLSACLNDGYAQAAVLSSDTPLVDARALAQAFAELDDGADVALGPCDDGGYYLMAVRAPHPEILIPIQMSTPNVLRDTLAAAAQAGLRSALLPPTCDVDTLDDLARMKEQLTRLPLDAARRTRAWLQQ